MKQYEEPDLERVHKTISSIKNEPNFKEFVSLLEYFREDSIRALQSESCIQCTNRHYMMSGKVEALDELLDLIANA